jgi:hypothetical protein
MKYLQKSVLIQEQLAVEKNLASKIIGDGATGSPIKASGLIQFGFVY